MSVDCYDRNGQPMTLEEWALANQDRSYRFIAQHTIGNIWVSTIWLGIDMDVMNLFRDPPMPPLIFESMIFEIPQGDDNWTSLEMRRYRTEKEAMVGHTELVHIANTIEALGKEVTDDERGEGADLPNGGGSERAGPNGELN